METSNATVVLFFPYIVFSIDYFANHERMQEIMYREFLNLQKSKSHIVSHRVPAQFLFMYFIYFFRKKHCILHGVQNTAKSSENFSLHLTDKRKPKISFLLYCLFLYLLTLNMLCFFSFVVFLFDQILDLLHLLYGNTKFFTSSFQEIF